MDLWLLNHVPTVPLAVLVVGGFVLVALGSSVLALRRFPGLADGEYNDMAGVLLGMFGAIYGIILAFVVVNLWTELHDAGHIVATEASAVSQIVRDAEAFPPATRDAVHAAVHDYVHAVVEDQWPLMREGQGDSAVTTRAVDGMYRVFVGYQPETPAEEAFYGKALDSLNEVAGLRRSRLADSRGSLPALLQALIFGGAVVMTALALMYGVRDRRARLLFVGTVATLIGFSLLLVVVLDRPFSGDLSVSPQPFKESALARFW